MYRLPSQKLQVCVDLDGSLGLRKLSDNENSLIMLQVWFCVVAAVRKRVTIGGKDAV